jgi:hypothetical protein
VAYRRFTAPRINIRKIDVRGISTIASIFTRATRTTGRRVVLIAIGLALIAGIATPAFAGGSNTPAPTHNAAAVASQPIAKSSPAHAHKQAAHKQAAHKPAAHKSAPAHKPAAAPAAVPTMNQLMTHGKPSGQSSIKTSATQVKNAKAIVEAGKKLHLPPRAWVIAVATSMQETKLHNYGSLGANNDHDSLGLFQQRPSSGWGSPKQLQNPTYAATKFYKALTHVHDWKKLPLTVAAQKVQVSAFGDRYAQWESQAANLVMHTAK